MQDLEQADAVDGPGGARDADEQPHQAPAQPGCAAQRRDGRAPAGDDGSRVGQVEGDPAAELRVGDLVAADGGDASLEDGEARRRREVGGPAGLESHRVGAARVHEGEDAAAGPGQVRGRP